MKTILLSSCISLLMLSANAQITVTSNDYTLPIGSANAVKLLKATQLNTISLPSEGDNKLWDYSNVNINDSVDFFYNLNNNSGVFRASNAYNTGNEVIGDYTLQNATKYITKNDSLVIFDGYSIPKQTFGGGSYTGLVDSVVFPAQDVKRVGVLPYLYFDLTRNLNKTFSATEVISSTVYDALGIMGGATGTYTKKYTINIEGKGWGKAILPISNDTVECILIKHLSKYSLDYVTQSQIGPISSTLIDSNINTSYFLVAKGYKSPIAIFDLAENSSSLQQASFVNGPPAQVDTTSDSSTSLVNINLPAIKAYPNPTSSQLIFDLDASNKYTASVYDINGRLILEAVLSNNKLDVQDFNIGSYIVYIKKENIETGFVKFIKQ